MRGNKEKTKNFYYKSLIIIKKKLPREDTILYKFLKCTWKKFFWYIIAWMTLSYNCTTFSAVYSDEVERKFFMCTYTRWKVAMIIVIIFSLISLKGVFPLSLSILSINIRGHVLQLDEGLYTI